MNKNNNNIIVSLIAIITLLCIFALIFVIMIDKDIPNKENIELVIGITPIILTMIFALWIKDKNEK